jgi:hypothetical protein
MKHTCLEPKLNLNFSSRIHHSENQSRGLSLIVITRGLGLEIIVTRFEYRFILLWVRDFFQFALKLNDRIQMIIKMFSVESIEIIIFLWYFNTREKRLFLMLSKVCMYMQRELIKLHRINQLSKTFFCI